jgi:hypothetical protein
LGFLLSLWGAIWTLVIAFGEKAAQGIMCLLIPFYMIYYTFSRWRQTKGAFALQASFFIALLFFSVVGVGVMGLMPGGKAGDRSSAAARTPSAPKANRALVKQAEATFRQDIKAIDGLTNELAKLRDFESIQRAGGTVRMAARMLQLAARRSAQVTLRDIEWVALKHSVGTELRSSLLALKQECLRVNAMPGVRGKFGDAASALDKSIDFWVIKPGEETRPELVDGPALPIAAGHPPGPGRPGGGPWAPPGPFGSVPSDPRSRYKQMVAQYGNKAVLVLFSGLPSNSDPARGVTARDVSEALNKCVKALAPGATNWLALTIDNESGLALAPVDDIRALVASIDFGKVTMLDNVIHVLISKDYVDSVPRLPAEPAVAAAGARPPDPEPEIPANADPVATSLIQLKSPDINRKKEAIQRLGRTTPNDRLDEVIGALMPLLDHDDGFLVNDVVKTMAIWRSPAAVPALIARTGDNRFFVRKEAIKTLGRYKDARAIEPIAQRLKEDGFEAEAALKEIGSIAEPALIERLKSDDPDIRRSACNVLKEIGGSATLEAMQSIRPDSDFAVRVAAQDAMKQIRARVGPLPSRARAAKASSSTPSDRKRKIPR